MVEGQGSRPSGLAAKAPIDYRGLRRHLQILAHESRLALLFHLQRPRTVDEIRLVPGPSRAGTRPDRPISRQAIQHHLNQLLAAGLVHATVREQRKEGHGMKEYVLDAPRLFALIEELRKINAARSSLVPGAAETQQLGGPVHARWDPGPKLVLVHGVDEGRVFPLSSSLLHPRRGWIIGRSRAAAVCLDYDPFVSNENAEILRDREGFRLLDLRTARNGTSLNGEPLPTGGQAPLTNGDIIGLGRSVLVFREL